MVAPVAVPSQKRQILLRDESKMKVSGRRTPPSQALHWSRCFSLAAVLEAAFRYRPQTSRGAPPVNFSVHFPPAIDLWESGT